MSILLSSRMNVRLAPPVGLADGEPEWLLNFTMQTQQQTQWCWSAVSVSVSHFYNASSSWTQCDLADRELGQRSCCRDGSTGGCNQPWFLDRGLRTVGNFDSVAAGATSKDTVKAVVPAGRVIGVRIKWPDETGHFVVIHGYMEYFDGDMGFHVKDPQNGYAFVFYDQLRTRYLGRGTWSHTYFTKA